MSSVPILSSPPVRRAGLLARSVALWERYWWVPALLLLLLPAALALFFLVDSPDDATFNYAPF